MVGKVKSKLEAETTVQGTKQNKTRQEITNSTCLSHKKNFFFHLPQGKLRRRTTK
jgi:hypothetical protein